MPVSEKRNIRKPKLKGRREEVKEAPCSKYFSQTCLEMWHSIPLICPILCHRQKFQFSKVFLQAHSEQGSPTTEQSHQRDQWNQTVELGRLTQPVPLKGPQDDSPCSLGPVTLTGSKSCLHSWLLCALIWGMVIMMKIVISTSQDYCEDWMSKQSECAKPLEQFLAQSVHLCKF